MADHTVTLTADQERTLAALAVQAQDPAVTVDTLLNSFVHVALLQPVTTLITHEAQALAAIYIATDAATRASIQQVAGKAQAAQGDVSSTAAPVTP